MSLLLGIDFGTSYFKIGLFDAAGGLRGLSRKAVVKETPQPKRCELPIAEFWRLVRDGLAEALAQANATAREIAAVSYSSQASTFVLLDRHDEPLTPLIVWLDERGGAASGIDAAFARAEKFGQTVGFTGLSPNSAPVKWRWFQRREPELWRRTARIMTLSDYFTFVLTGERVGDASTAAFLGLYDLARENWWPEALAHFEVDSRRLSRPLRPGVMVGKTVARANLWLGLAAGVTFAAGGLDHHVAAIGSGIGVLGDVSISTGTVLAALAMVDGVRPTAGCFHGAHVDGRRFYRLAFDANGAAELEDYQRRHAPEIPLEVLAANVPESDRRGTDADMTTAHREAVRVILEGIARRHRELVGRIVDLVAVQNVVATGGGARSPWLLQLDAKRLGCRVRTTRCAERACLGAALLAAVASGRYRSFQEAGLAMVQADASFG